MLRRLEARKTACGLGASHGGDRGLRRAGGGRAGHRGAARPGARRGARGGADGDAARPRAVRARGRSGMGALRAGARADAGAGVGVPRDDVGGRGRGGSGRGPRGDGPRAPRIDDPAPRARQPRRTGERDGHDRAHGARFGAGRAARDGCGAAPRGTARDPRGAAELAGSVPGDAAARGSGDGGSVFRVTCHECAPGRGGGRGVRDDVVGSGSPAGRGVPARGRGGARGARDLARVAPGRRGPGAGGPAPRSSSGSRFRETKTVGRSGRGCMRCGAPVRISRPVRAS